MGIAAKDQLEIDARGLRIAVVAARYNAAIVDQMIAGAEERWAGLGGDPASLRLMHVPGAFELPLAARQLARARSVDAVVVLGCVIRGDTAHFDFVAGECARGVQQVMLDTGIPVSFGVLTTDNEAQAQIRASVSGMNKGAEAVDSAVQMVRLLQQL
jgi:6,7-dimethyl-8-ribityllumazine synthase